MTQGTQEDNYKNLKDAGYHVDYVSENWYWAMNPAGYSLTRGPIQSEQEAWEQCQRDYDNRK